MKPATVFFRSCGLTAVLLAGAVNFYAGVYVQNPDDPRFFAEETKCQQEVVDADSQYAIDKLRCNHQYIGEKENKGCLQWADGRFAAAINKVQIHRNNNNGTHQKAIIDFQRASESKLRVTGRTPKDKAENIRHFNAETTFQKEVVDADTQYENDKVLCHTESGIANTDYISDESACMLKVGYKWDTALLEIKIHRTTEDATHQKNQIANERSDQG